MHRSTPLAPQSIGSRVRHRPVCFVSTVGEWGREKVLSLEGEATSIEGFRMRKLDLGRQWARTESEIDEKKSVKW